MTNKYDEALEWVNKQPNWKEKDAIQEALSAMSKSEVDVGALKESCVFQFGEFNGGSFDDDEERAIKFVIDHLLEQGIIRGK